MTDKAREEFEQWVMSNQMTGATLWDAWKASRAALAIELPVFDDYPASIDADMRESLRAVIEAAGLKVKP